MTMWADNIKFVKDIIDGKYQKIDSAAAEVPVDQSWLDFSTKIFLLDDWECWEFTEGPKVSEEQRAFHVCSEGFRVG